MPLKKSAISLSFIMLLALLWSALSALPAPAAEPVVIWSGPPTVRQVAITFDDGPSPRYTPQILALFKRYQAHATFFVLGRKVESYPRLVQAQLRAGNEVGNHTFDHPRLPKIAQLAREAEVERTAVDLELLGDKESRWIRPPYSAFDDRLKAYVAHTHGRLVLWSIDSGDWRGLDRRRHRHFSPCNIAPRRMPVPLVVTLFDLHWFIHPGLFNPLHLAYVRRAITWSVRRAKRIITISENSKKRYPDHFQHSGTEDPSDLPRSGPRFFE